MDEALIIFKIPDLKVESLFSLLVVFCWSLLKLCDALAAEQPVVYLQVRSFDNMSAN